ncbi:MAG: MFS transporter [Candidatus Melainabacteria bacterium]|nr:MFS transporter [Candidatus Melainabacteria bacterium]
MNIDTPSHGSSTATLAEPGNNIPRAPWWSGINRYHLLVFLGCWLGGIFDGMDSTLMSVVLPVAIGDLIGARDPQSISQVGSWVTTLFLVGWMLGGLLFGYLGDRLGRVKAMMLSILLYSLFTGLSGLVDRWELLALCRFLTGLGIGGELVTIATFLTEVWPSRSRAMAVGTLITSYQGGVFLAGSIHYVFEGWRTVFFVGALPALLVLFLRMTLKESDRWLMAQSEAHPSKTTSDGLWRRLFQPEHRRAVVVGSLAFGSLLVGYWASLAWIPAWVQSLIDAQQLQGLTHARSLATMAQGLAAMVGCTVAGWLCDRLGRRWTLSVAALGAFFASALLFLGNTTFSTIIYGQSAILGFFIGLLQSGLYIYLPELFPTKIRATGTGFCLNAGRLVTAIAVFNVGPLVGLFGGYAAAAFAFSLAYLVTCAAMLLGQETRHRPLPE